MTYIPNCSVCGKPVTFAKGNKENDTFTPGDYQIIGIERTGQAAAYGRAANHGYQNVYVHLGDCMAAYMAARQEANAEPTTAQQQTGSEHDGR